MAGYRREAALRPGSDRHPMSATAEGGRMCRCGVGWVPRRPDEPSCVLGTVYGAYSVYGVHGRRRSAPYRYVETSPFLGGPCSAVYSALRDGGSSVGSFTASRHTG